MVGFPLGASGLPAKVAEARIAIEEGADEIDMMISLGLARSGRWVEVGNEIAAVVDVVAGRLVKVILETAALTADEVARGAEVAVAAGAGMVKTSTGFHSAGGATLEAVRLLRRIVGNGVGVKASGGIRTAEQAVLMLAAGASRLGTSSAALWGDYLGPAAPSLESLLLRFMIDNTYREARRSRRTPSHPSRPLRLGGRTIAIAEWSWVMGRGA